MPNSKEIRYCGSDYKGGGVVKPTSLGTLGLPASKKREELTGEESTRIWEEAF